jgi:lipoprotein-anchoring transpeptidase ErfK/SrfK
MGSHIGSKSWEHFQLMRLIPTYTGEVMNINISVLKSASVLAAVLWIGSAVAAPLSGSAGDPGALLDGASAGFPSEMQRQVVDFQTRFPPGSVVIDTEQTYLYYVLSDGQAIRYGIGVGRDGFTWSGEQAVTRKAEWPDWTPPAGMIDRQPYLPRWMAGGDGNPLGARAIYLGSTIYRIHGTNAPATIGQRVSSGCIRMLNADVIDLYNRVSVGTRIVVMRGGNADPRISSRVASAPRVAVNSPANY